MSATVTQLMTGDALWSGGPNFVIKVIGGDIQPRADRPAADDRFQYIVESGEYAFGFRVYWGRRRDGLPTMTFLWPQGQARAAGFPASDMEIAAMDATQAPIGALAMELLLPALRIADAVGARAVVATHESAASPDGPVRGLLIYQSLLAHTGWIGVPVDSLYACVELDHALALALARQRAT